MKTLFTNVLYTSNANEWKNRFNEIKPTKFVHVIKTRNESLCFLGTKSRTTLSEVQLSSLRQENAVCIIAALGNR